MKTSQETQLQPLEYYLSLKYPISLYPEEEGGYTAIVDDLPGWMSTGETVEFAIANINEARELWLETVYLSRKREIPLPKKEPLGVKTPS